MKRLFNSYINYFNTYAGRRLSEFHSLQQIGIYAIDLTALLNKLLNRALLNGLPNHEQLQKEMSNSGKEFIQQFAAHFRISGKVISREVKILL